MPILHRFTALAVFACVLAPVHAGALDDFLRASSAASTKLSLCQPDGELAKSGACKETDFDALTSQIEKSLQRALAKAPANIRPLLKRDQVWSNEIVLNAADSLQYRDDEQKDAFVERLRRRATTLDQIAAGFGRSGLAGQWVNTFGSVTVTPADGGYRLAIDISVDYGEPRPECKLTAEVKSTSGSWLSGIALSGEAAPAKTADDKSEPSRLPAIRMRRQGDTLRIVVGYDAENNEDRPDCTSLEQITASYFADGKTDTAAADKAEMSFVAPTFDCTRPASASDEEICADPEMAENDQKLNRAWKALLPRLDETTRRALTEDQRNWVRAQTNQYPQFLHPAWNKQSPFVHYTADGREKLARLQRERIALLEGFDDKRNGLAGIWLSHTAILKVTLAADGTLKAEGWKWDQGDWKAGCEFDIKGKVEGGAFRSEEQRKNPDTLERDHAMLIVNRQDDAFAKKREGKDADEPKCRRMMSASSTARLFPAKPSPDIDNLGGSIR